jgi:hypothetical protein
LEPNTIAGKINYLGRMTERPVSYAYARDKGNLIIDSQEVSIYDIRKAVVAPTLEREGFVRADLPLDVDDPLAPEAIAAALHPPLMEIMRRLTGAPKVVISPPYFRWSEKSRRRLANAPTPARYVHCDYGRESFHSMMQSILESDPDKAHWLGGRFATYNVWRTLTPPPHDVPLAVLDRSTVCVEDFVVGTVFVGSEENPWQPARVSFATIPTIAGHTSPI